MTRVLLDASPLSGPAAGRGIGRYVTALHAALTTFADVETFDIPARAGRLGELRELPDRGRATRVPHDLLHTPTAYHAPLRPRGPWVASILDVIPLDLGDHRRTGIKARLFHRLSARADVILTLSQHSAGRIHELLGVPRERVIVAPLPISVSLIAGDLPTGLAAGSYVLALVDLATPDPRKRAEWLPKLAAQLDVPLVLVGAGTQAAFEGTRGLGRVDDSTWAALLSNAGVFVYTSAYEGQGLPPLEAMALGAPVVAMDNTAVHEFVREAGILVDEGPDAVERLANACRQVLGDVATQTRLATAGRKRAGEFSAERFNRQVRQASDMAISLFLS